ncbi:unnamed protein product, partial [Scytosiphon promiscuus]
MDTRGSGCRHRYHHPYSIAPHWSIKVRWFCGNDSSTSSTRKRTPAQLPYNSRAASSATDEDHTPSTTMRSDRDGGGGGGSSGAEDEGAASWTPSELRVLRQSIRDNGLEDWRTLGDWTKVAEEVGGGKTPEQCFNRWHAEYNQQAALEEQRQQLLRQQHQHQQHQHQHQHQWQGQHPSAGLGSGGRTYHPHLYQQQQLEQQQQLQYQQQRQQQYRTAGQHQQPRHPTPPGRAAAADARYTPPGCRDPQDPRQERHHHRLRQHPRAPASEHHWRPVGDRGGGGFADDSDAPLPRIEAAAALPVPEDGKGSSYSGGREYGFDPTQGAAFGGRPSAREPHVQTSLSGWQPPASRGACYGFGGSGASGGG